jgi:phosphoheptose isomerase
LNHYSYTPADIIQETKNHKLFSISFTYTEPTVYYEYLYDISAIAKEMGMKTVALTGNDGGVIGKIAHISLIVSSTSTPRIQETHILIGHILCEMVEHQLFLK